MQRSGTESAASLDRMSSIGRSERRQRRRGIISLGEPGVFFASLFIKLNYLFGVGMNELSLWKQVPMLSVDEFMNLLFGFVPGTVKFDYGNPESWPNGAAIIYKLLTADIWAEKLFVTIADPHHDPRISEYFYETYGLSGNPWWADADGKLSKHQLIKWLAKKGISSDFFDVHITRNELEKTVETYTAYIATQSSTLPVEPINTSSPLKTKKKYRRGAISASNAAKLLNISERQVRNWDKGINMPEGYPGRMDEMAFQLFVNQWKKVQLLKSEARKMNRPSCGGGIADYLDRGSPADYEEYESEIES